MESTLVMSSGAIVSFLVYYSLVDLTYLETIPNKSAIISFQWEFNEWNCGTAFVIGMVCAALGIGIMLTIGITKQFLNRIRFRLQKYPAVAAILPSCIAGLIIGLVNYALPLTIGKLNLLQNSTLDLQISVFRQWKSSFSFSYQLWQS